MIDSKPSMSRDGSGPIGRAVGRVTRYSEILRVLIRYGFSDIVRRVDSEVYRRFRGRERNSRRARRNWSRPERMRRALEELGPAFIKIGQILSHRPDLLPSDWIEEFAKLRGSVPPVPTDELLEAFEEELGASPEDLFESFNPEPLASASIAQVHRAILKSGDDEPGRPVVVKIQRPDIRRIIEADLNILNDLARIAERRLPSLSPFRPVEAVRELDRALRDELNFRNEADNLDRFRRNFSATPGIIAPEPVRQFSSARVLTMDFIDGVPVADIPALKSLGVDRKALARRGAESVLAQIFEHRFFHSDPHGQNILVTEEGTIAFLDFGQVGSVLPSQRLFLADLISAIVRTDAPRAVRAILNWSGYRDPEVVHRLNVDMENLIDVYLSRSFGELDLGAFITELFGIVQRYRIEIPSQFYLLAKALATIENIASELDPDFDFMRAARPFVRKMIRREMSPQQIAGQLTSMSADSLRLLRDLPGDTRDLISLLKAGRLRMEFELKDLERLDSTFKRVVTRLSAAVLLAAMIMGSSILVQSGIPPLIYRIPVIGLMGFAFSGLIGLFLLLDLWRHR